MISKMFGSEERILLRYLDIEILTMLSEEGLNGVVAITVIG